MCKIQPLRIYNIYETVFLNRSYNPAIFKTFRKITIISVTDKIVLVKI